MDYQLYPPNPNRFTLMRKSLRSALLLVNVFVLAQLNQATCSAQDWPMWRYDSSRTASSDNGLAKDLQLRWVLNNQTRRQAWDDPLNMDLMTYDRVFEPIVIDGIVIVPFNEESKVVAYRLEDGEKCWSFYTEAPVRLPPAGANGKICFCSDDGYLYCVDSKTGHLFWKFFGGSNTQKALGNRHLVSAWPARGGPVIHDQHVYFSASIWPFMGVFIYSLDLETGVINWVNDQCGSTYIKQPHSAPSFAGVAPQGAFAATDKHLIVPGGRSVPAVLDRLTGALKHFELNAGGKGNGGSFVAAESSRYFVHTRLSGTRAFSMEDGMKQDFTPNRPVLFDGCVISAEQDSNSTNKIRCFNEADQIAWEIVADGTGDLIRAGDELLAVGGGNLTRIQWSHKKDSASIIDAIRVPEDARRILVANEMLILVTDSGLIQAYGPPVQDHLLAQDFNEKLDPLDRSPTLTDTDVAERLLDRLENSNQNTGYAIWFGGADTEDLKFFVLNSQYDQVMVVDSREPVVHQLRCWLDERELHGRVTVHCSDPKEFRPPSYIASSVVFFADPDERINFQLLQGAYQSVRPYGGTFLLPRFKLDSLSSHELKQLESLEQAKVSQEHEGIVLTKSGRLPGSADWTHQYGDVGNTIKSDDSRVKLPLGVLWFGGTSHLDVLPRHGHGPSEQVVGGRLFIQGIDCLSARDVYTGRLLWKKTFEDLGTYDVYYDATFEETPLNPKYNQVHIPGANGRGTNYVVTEDRVYLAAQDRCHVLDSVTGKTLFDIELPSQEAISDNPDTGSNRPQWGYLAVYRDVLIGGLGFANYQDQLDLNYEADKKLSRSRAGFGGKSVDRAASRSLVGFNRHTGELLWEIPSNYSFWHNGIVAGGEQIYCLDRYPIRVEQALMRRGKAAPATYRIASFNYLSGELAWEITDGVFGTWLSYSDEFDLLLQAGSAASDRLTDEVSKGMAVHRAGDGSLKWRNDELRYTGPCILHHDWIITNTNAYADSAGAFFLHDGHQKMVPNPITGELEAWYLNRAYGCNHIIASENMLTFRSGAAGYYDLLNDGGTGNFGGFKSGCTSNLVVANGVLNAPDYTRTCSCAYQNQTSLALVHMPEIDLWSVDDFAVGSSVASPIRHLGINFGAPGDRRDDKGNLWIEYPAIAGDSINIDVKWNHDVKIFRRHTSQASRTDYPWIFASGLEGVEELSLKLDQLGNINPDRANRYQLVVYVVNQLEGQSGEVEMSLRGEKKRIKLKDIATDFDVNSGRLKFDGVTLGDDLMITIRTLSGKPIVCAIELIRQ